MHSVLTTAGGGHSHEAGGGGGKPGMLLVVHLKNKQSDISALLITLSRAPHRYQRVWQALGKVLRPRYISKTTGTIFKIQRVIDNPKEELHYCKIYV